MTKAQQQEQEKAREALRKVLKPGTKVYTHLDHVSRSGMLRAISVYVSDEDGMHTLTEQVAQALGDRLHKSGGVVITGCGMDMGFALVYNLSWALYPDGFECTGKDEATHRSQWCPANDHVNGDRDYTPHRHSQGGYALRQCWL